MNSFGLNFNTKSYLNMNFLNILNCQWLSQSISQIILTIAGIGFIRLLYKKYISPILYLMKLGIKFPLPKPFIGNCTDEGATNQHIAQLKRQEKYGNINGTLFFSIPTIWIGDPNVLKAVTVKEFSNFTNRYKFVKSRPPFDDSVLQLDNAEWKRVRSILMQAFSAAKLKEIVPILTDVCKSINEDIELVEREQRSIEIWRESGKFSMKVMLAIAFGLDFESKDQEQKS